LFDLGLLRSPCALATLAPDQADTYLVANGGDKTKNFGKEPALKIGAGASTLIRFDLSTLPDGTTAADVEKASVLLWVNKVDTAGSITVQPATSAWSELVVTITRSLGGSARRWSRPRGEPMPGDRCDGPIKAWLTTGTNNGLALVAVGSTSFQLDSKENGGTTPNSISVVQRRCRGRWGRGTSGQHRGQGDRRNWGSWVTGARVDRSRGSIGLARQA
jgi:hypothetical protein